MSFMSNNLCLHFCRNQWLVLISSWDLLTIENYKITLALSFNVELHLQLLSSKYKLALHTMGGLHQQQIQMTADQINTLK